MEEAAARGDIVRLDRGECVRLLSIEDVGRLAIIQADRPAIFPVNYALDGESIVFRTDPGTKLTYGPRGAAAFEIDGLDRVRREAWSVVVNGHLEEITASDGDLLGRASALDVRPWAQGAKEFWMRLVPNTITGRRIGPPPPKRTAPAPDGWAGPPGSATPL